MLVINFLASLSGQLAQQVRDFDVDVRTDTNFATTVGRPAARTCLRAATAALVLAVITGFLTGALPLVLAPLPLAFTFSAVHRLRGGAVTPSPLQIALPTASALAYVSFLMIAGLP
jgi:4-hydroxybenzoate polyprenyltransferase